jgi:hypothetical protein
MRQFIVYFLDFNGVKKGESHPYDHTPYIMDWSQDNPYIVKHINKYQGICKESPPIGEFFTLNITL